LFEWLNSTLLLRSIALKARKARPDLYARAASADTETDEEEELDAGEEEQEVEVTDGEMLDEKGNKISNVNIARTLPE
jgi:hypothetical protein